MEPIAEGDENARSSSWFCCPTSEAEAPKNNGTERGMPLPTTMERGVNSNNPSERPTLRKKHSVYISAVSTLGEAELAALREFEEAAMASEAFSDESVYFDALESEDDNTTNTSKALSYAPAQVADPRPRESVSMADPSSLLKVLKELKEPRVNVECAGYPGNLTEEELSACQQFRAELQRRKTDVQNNGRTYEDVVRVYDPVETEPYSLCRFLRARQFNVDKVFEMISEVLDVWREAQKHDYFPDPNAALGAPVNVFLTQMPTIYSGCAKNGSPVAYAFAADLSIEGIECLTELERIEKYAWYTIVHKFKKEIARGQEANPDAVRCEAIQIVDIKGLNASVLNKRTLDTLAKLIVVNKCFPEVLNSMVILNAPRFFSFFWRIIKAMLDPRTASKVEMFSNEQEGINWMLERIDKSELLADYGGDGPSFEEVMNNQNSGANVKRQVVKRFGITQLANDTVEFTLGGNEMARFKAYTRSTAGAEFELCQDGNTITQAQVVGSPAMKPFSVDLFADVRGPGNFIIKSKGKSTTSLDYFVIAGEVVDKE